MSRSAVALSKFVLGALEDSFWTSGRVMLLLAMADILLSSMLCARYVSGKRAICSSDSGAIAGVGVCKGWRRKVGVTRLV